MPFFVTLSCFILVAVLRSGLVSPMKTKNFSSKILAKLARLEGERLDEERSRERASEGISNIYRDRRDPRLPLYSFRIGQNRKGIVVVGVLLGVLIHLLSGINLIICTAVFGACALLIFERWREVKRARDAHFD